MYIYIYIGFRNFKNKPGFPNGNLHHMCWSQNGGFTTVSQFHIAFFLETQLDTMVFVGHGQTTPCKEMGPLPTQGLICWWFHGSMLLQPQGVSDKTNMNQEDSGSTYSNKCLGMDSHCFTYHIANGGINSKQTSFHQGQPSHRWNKRTCVCFF